MQNKLGVLHIDDDSLIRLITKASLEASGNFAVLNYSSGPEAIKYTEHSKFDLILLDYSMPEMNGIQTLNGLRKNNNLKNSPAIFITSTLEPENIKEYYNAGAIGIIGKPFDPEILPELVRKLWNKHIEATG